MFGIRQAKPHGIRDHTVHYCEDEQQKTEAKWNSGSWCLERERDEHQGSSDRTNWKHIKGATFRKRPLPFTWVCLQSWFHFGNEMLSVFFRFDFRDFFHFVKKKVCGIERCFPCVFTNVFVARCVVHCVFIKQFRRKCVNVTYTRISSKVNNWSYRSVCINKNHKFNGRKNFNSRCLAVKESRKHGVKNVSCQNLLAVPYVLLSLALNRGKITTKKCPPFFDWNPLF